MKLRSRVGTAPLKREHATTFGGAACGNARIRTHRHIPHTAVQQHFVVAISRLIDSRFIWSIPYAAQRISTCAVASTLSKAFGQQENVSSKSDPQEAGGRDSVLNDSTLPLLSTVIMRTNLLLPNSRSFG